MGKKCIKISKALKPIKICPRICVSTNQVNPSTWTRLKSILYPTLPGDLHYEYRAADLTISHYIMVPSCVDSVDPGTQD